MIYHTIKVKIRCVGGQVLARHKSGSHGRIFKQQVWVRFDSASLTCLVCPSEWRSIYWYHSSLTIPMLVVNANVPRSPHQSDEDAEIEKDQGGDFQGGQWFMKEDIASGHW